MSTHFFIFFRPATPNTQTLTRLGLSVLWRTLTTPWLSTVGSLVPPLVRMESPAPCGRLTWTPSSPIPSLSLWTPSTSKQAHVCSVLPGPLTLTEMPGWSSVPLLWSSVERKVSSSLLFSIDFFFLQNYSLSNHNDLRVESCSILFDCMMCFNLIIAHWVFLNIAAIILYLG